ncbi:putative transcriptional regulator, LysR family [Treponema primitia ZAS-2]|uniref:Putative transcriptional regulator, LysR family n=1 Tax=Treponema primitia (strain ATCC BAA-887 / DSM 12427 / ZAS-2) TaxID=545694 RepID=F5YIA8_TREPZ|nr:LysR family transcriptional regulator [Treponema primitia]AEF84596.1 putative transcriptional regulator, LysR family [Treponema primitia ZAS-2]
MDYKQLRNFLAVCDEKNFTKASSQRFITQQGLSISIKALEDELEVPLFYRNPKGIELTEFGRVLETAAKSYTNQHDHIIDTIRQLREKAKSQVSIGIANGLDHLFPPLFLSTFIVEHPDISLNIMNFVEETCQKSMRENKLQIGFSPAPVDMNLFASLICERNKIGLLVGEKHPFAERSSVKLQELKGEMVISLNNRMHPFDLLWDQCIRNGVVPEINLSSPAMELTCELISTNRVVGFGGGPQDRFPGLVHIEIEDMDFYWEFHLIVNKYAFISDAAKEFIAYAKERFNTQ